MIDVANTIVRGRRWIAAGILLLGILILPFAHQSSQRLAVGGSTVDRSEAEYVDELLDTEFKTPFASNLILVVTGIPTVAGEEGLDLLFDIVAAVTEVDSVERVLSYIDAVDPVFVSEYGTFVVVGFSPGERDLADVVLELRQATALLRQELSKDYPTIELFWTGDAAFDYDIRLTSAMDASKAEKRVFPLTMLLLFIVFGSLVSAFFPVVIAGVGVGLSLGAAVLISAYWPMTILLENIVTMIGLGIGIDYCLLMLSRFREELAVDSDPEAAAVRALRTAGHTILLSGGAVAIGFAALLIVPATELRSIATGGLLIVSFSVCLATMLLPGLMTWLGPRVEFGRVRRAPERAIPSERWQQWGRWVTVHPVLILIVVALPLTALALKARDISTDIPSGSWLPKHMESTKGVMGLQRMGHSGIVQTIRVLVEFPADTRADSAPGMQAVLDVHRYLETDDRVERVNSLPQVLGVEDGEQASIAFIQPELHDAFISTNAQIALIEIVPRESASAGELMRYARELRSLDISAVTNLAGTRLVIGGLPARNADYQDAVGGSARDVILIVVVGSFLALLIGFRSLLCAIKAVGLNLLSVAAAMGVTVLVFQDGYGSEWLGVSGVLDGLFPAVPIIVFCVVYGLSMDYEVFLLSRVAENVRLGMSNSDAIVSGLARTGSVITSAALVMIVVFAGFALGEFLIIKILGFALATAILIDATLVRLAIGPALMQLGGRWNWWPGRRVE